MPTDLRNQLIMSSRSLDIVLGGKKMPSLGREDHIPAGHSQSRTPETTVKMPMVLKANQILCRSFCSGTPFERHHMAGVVATDDSSFFSIRTLIIEWFCFSRIL